MQCRNCSGNEFRKTESGNYKCVYCGTLYHVERSGVKKTGNMNIKTAAAAVSGIIVISAVITAVLFFNKGKETPPENYADDKISHQENGSTFMAEEMPEPEGSVLSVEMIPDSIGNHYFIALCKNTGKVAVRTPHVTVRLYSGNNSKVGSGSGYAFMNDLNPGEITPVLILVQKPPQYSRFETEYIAELPFVIPEGGVFENRFIGEISDARLKMTGVLGSYKLKGSIKNSCVHNAKYVQVAAVLYNSSDKIIGYGSTFINEKVLKPGDFDIFDMYITVIKGTPDHFKLYYYGMVN